MGSTGQREKREGIGERYGNYLEKHREVRRLHYSMGSFPHQTLKKHFWVGHQPVRDLSLKRFTEPEILKEKGMTLRIVEIRGSTLKKEGGGESERGGGGELKLVVRTVGSSSSRQNLAGRLGSAGELKREKWF